MAAVGQQKEEKASTKVRQDPAPGNLYGPLAMTELQNRDPNKHYVLVAKHKLTMAEYRNMGYRAEVGREGGVSVAGEDVQEGREVECLDHVLMSVSKERHAQIERQGAFGGAGQEYCDRIDAAIIDKRAQQDNFRGITNRRGKDYFRVRSETEGLVEETENG